MSGVRNMDEIDEAEEEALLKSDDDENNDNKDAAERINENNDKDETDESSTSDEDSEDSDDLENSRAALELVYNDLIIEISNNNYNYDNYVKLVEIAYKLTDIDKLRKSHELFSKFFPLAPEIWLKYINTENNLVTTQSEIDNVKNLYSNALKDYYNTDIAYKFAKFIMNYEIADKEETWDEILSTYGLHTMEGRKFYALFRKYNENTNTDIGQKNDFYVKSFLKELRIPLQDMEESYIELKVFAEKNKKDISINWNEVDKYYNRAKGHLQRMLPYEKELASLDMKQYRERAELYLKYIKEADNFVNENVLQTLYERMITDCCLNPECWSNYISFIEHRDKYRPSELENFPVFNQTILDISERSIRNCTWNDKFYLLRFNLMEKYNKSKRDFQLLLETGLSVNFPTPECEVKLWLEYLSYLRRHTDYNNEEECDTLRKTFDLCWNSLGSKWGTLADCNCEILLFWGRLEYGPLKYPEKGRDLWNVAMESSDNATKSALWIEFIQLEMGRCPENATKLFQKALKTPGIDNPYVLISIWKRYENCNGTLKQLMNCNKFCDSLLTEMENVRNTRHEKSDLKPKGNLKRKKDEEHIQLENKGSIDLTFKKPFPKELQYSDPSPPKKPRREPVLPNIMKEHENDEIDMSKDHIRIFLSNLDYNITEEDVRIGLPELQISHIDLIKTVNGRNRGFGYAELLNESEVEKAILYDRRLLKGRPVYISSVLRDKESRLKFKYSDGLEPKKIFVKGLPFDINKEEVENLFKPFGKLNDVRLVYHKSGKFKGIAYIEFNQEQSASAAVLGLDQHNLRGFTIDVAISAPPPKPMAKQSINLKTLGGGNPRKSTQIGEQKPRMTLIPTSVRKQNIISSNEPNVDKQTSKSNDDFRKMFMK